MHRFRDYIVFDRSKIAIFGYSLAFNSPMEGVPWDDLRKIFRECQWLAKIPNAIEILQKISTIWVGCTSATDRRQTDGRMGDSISSRLLKMMIIQYSPSGTDFSFIAAVIVSSIENADDYSCYKTEISSACWINEQDKQRQCKLQYERLWCLMIHQYREMFISDTGLHTSPCHWVHTQHLQHHVYLKIPTKKTVQPYFWEKKSSKH